MHIVYSKHGRKRKPATSDTENDLIAEVDEFTIKSPIAGGDPSRSMEAPHEDLYSPSPKEAHSPPPSPDLIESSNKEPTSRRIEFHPDGQDCVDGTILGTLPIEEAHDEVLSKQEIEGTLPGGVGWKDAGMEADWKETAGREGRQWKEEIVVCAESDAVGMVDLSAVVEGIPLHNDGLQEIDEGLESHYFSPHKDSFVLTIPEASSPLIGDLVVVNEHETTPFVDNDEPRDSNVRGSLDRTALRCHEHTLKLEEWKLTRKQKDLVYKAGFGHFIKIGSFTLDKQHITALVERWNKETNTFHLSVGEMTITLDEVAINLGLAIDGDPVVAVSGKDDTIGSMCAKYLGKSPSSSDKKGGFLKLGWLKDSFSSCPEDASLEKVEQHTRAYLLYLVGSTIFSTTTGNTVPVLYLPLFEDFDRAGKYAWGAAALAFLYRSLSNASSRAQNTISGCLTLLQCWSYLHLDIRRPRLSEKANHDLFPLALRWKQKQSGHRAKWSVLQYQNALDSLQLYDVEWMPYKNIVTVVPEEMNGSLILGKSKTTLLCLDKAEKHNPDRCLRQFGMPQPIPETVPKTKEADGDARQTERKELSHGEWLERRERIVEEDSGVDDEEYAEWYLKFSRNVRRKTSLEDVYQQTVIGLSKMLELAETLARDDMPTKNKEVVRSITTTLNDSLREVVAVIATPQSGP